MKPGQEMDALVAEKIMGLRVYRAPYINTVIVDAEENITGTVPAYSTDIAAAWQVVDHILDMHGEEGHYRKERFVLNVAEDGDLVRWRSEHAAYAICVSALQAFDIRD